MSENSTATDLDRYFELIEGGDLYDFLRQKSGYKQMGRKEFKARHFFKMLYGANLTECPVLTVFEREFPTLYSYVLHTKEVDRLRDRYRTMCAANGDRRKAYFDLKKEEKQTYGSLATQMQRAEAEFVFDRVVARLMQEHPVPLLTIHDCILTTKGNEGIVFDAMAEEFWGLGVSAQLDRVAY